MHNLLRKPITIRNVSDGKVLVTIDPRDTINQILEGEHKGGFRPEVFAMAFSPDGTRLATAGSVAWRWVDGTACPAAS